MRVMRPLLLILLLWGAYYGALWVAPQGLALIPGTPGYEVVHQHVSSFDEWMYYLYWHIFVVFCILSALVGAIAGWYTARQSVLVIFVVQLPALIALATPEWRNLIVSFAALAVGISTGLLSRRLRKQRSNI